MTRVLGHEKIKYFAIDAGDLSPVGAAPKSQVITSTATGGTVIITAGGESTTGVAIVAATTASNIKSYLVALDIIDVSDISVSGSAGGPFTVTGDFPDLSIDDTDATGGTVTVAPPTPATSSDDYTVSVGDLTGNDITDTIRSATGWSEPKTKVGVPDLGSKAPKTIPGLPTEAEPSIVIYVNDDPNSTDSQVRARLVEGWEGYIFRCFTGTPVAGTVGEIWPVKVMSADPTADADATSAAPQTIDVKFTVPDTVDRSVTVTA